MKRTFILLIASITTIVAVLGLLAAWKVFGFTHFFVTDAVGDVREMRGDGAQPEYWRDFIEYLLFYIPGLLIAILSTTFAVVACSLLKRGISCRQRSSNQAEQRGGGNRHSPVPHL